MGRVLTSSSIGLLEVRFCVAHVKDLGVKFLRDELKYATAEVALIQMFLNIHNKIKSYPLMIRELLSGSHIDDDRDTSSSRIIKVA